MGKIFFTTSWDDGSIYDIKLSKMLLNYNIKGTFYIPLKNDQIPKILSREEIKLISDTFEIGGHTFNHTILTKVSLERAREEIKSCKNALEDIIGKEIKAFCFPRGKYTQTLVDITKEYGFIYGRTVMPLRIKKVVDVRRGLMHTSLQVYPHNHYTYWISILKGNKEGLYNYFRVVNVVSDWVRLAEMLLENSSKIGIAFHLWGHSWEIEKYNLWEILEQFLKYVNKRNNVIFCTNTELWSMLNENK